MGMFARRGAELLAKAKITVNGTEPWDLRIKYPDRVFRKALIGGSLAFCESYMSGEWECDDLLGLLIRLFGARLDREVRGFSETILKLRNTLTNAQTVARSLRVGKKHYDLGNDFYSQWLDPSMTYSSARWSNVDNLTDAQRQKRRLIAEKLDIKPSMKVLDIGCGWGSFAKYLAEEYGAIVTGITISKEQARFAKNLCAGLPVKIDELDYRSLEGTYDRIVSVGMLEHVGVKNYNTYMKVASEHLVPGGFFVCHAIVGRPGAKGPFIDKYIFSGGELGATWQIQRAAERNGFVVEDWENFGHDYYRTLLAWYENFEKNWRQIVLCLNKEIIAVFGSRESFKRAWQLYLVGNAAAFFTRKVSVGQWVLSKQFRGEVYRTARP